MCVGSKIEKITHCWTDTCVIFDPSSSSPFSSKRYKHPLNAPTLSANVVVACRKGV